MKVFTYDTYQDVRKNLTYYSWVSLILAGFAAYEWILPPSHQESVNRAVKALTDSPLLGGLLKGGAAVAIFYGLAFLLIEILKVHDHIYDKYLIRWRFRYDIDLILQRLLQPFGFRIGRKVYSEVERNHDEFMEDLFYPFVGDQQHRVGKNLLVRFYERITIYWLTQVNEIVIALLIGLIGFYRFFGPPEPPQYYAQLLTVLLVLVLLFIINRLWMHTTREASRKITVEQLDQITANHLPELEQRLRTLCGKHQIPFN